MHTVNKNLIIGIFLHLGDIHHSTISQFPKFSIVDICSVQGKFTLERTLKANGISVEFKCNPNTGERQGVSFGYDDGKENHVFPGSKVGKEYSFAHLSRSLDRNQRAYEKRTRTITVQAKWTNPTPPKEQASVLEEGVGMAVGAVGALGDLFQTHAPEEPQTLEEFDRMRKRYAQKPRRGLKH